MDLDPSGKIVDRVFAMAKLLDDAQAHRVGQRLEEQ
jgi:hypothetical protein